MLLYALVVWTACLLLLVQIARVRWRFTAPRGWLFLLVPGLLAAAASIGHAPGHAGKASVALSLAVVTLPLLVETILKGLVRLGWPDLALRLGRACAFVHPAAAWQGDRLRDHLLAPAAGAPTPWVTYGLVAANLALFGVALLLGGATDRPTLYRLGALAPLEVATGGAWRLLAGLFLHFGPIHLTMNLFALLGLGRFLEPAVGRRRFLLIFLLAGVGSMAAVTLLTLTGLRPPRLLVGASGGIMGLLGASLAYALADWRAHRDAHGRRLLITILVLLGFQVAMDLHMPQISLSAHLGGLGIGFVAYQALTRRQRAPTLAATAG